MIYFVGGMIGGVIGSYLILRLLMYGCRKLRRVPNDATTIAGSGLMALLVITVIAGYGLQDGGPEPQFLVAFSTYFGPAMLATVIELVRLARRSDPAPDEATVSPKKEGN